MKRMHASSMPSCALSPACGLALAADAPGYAPIRAIVPFPPGGGNDLLACSCPLQSPH